MNVILEKTQICNYRNIVVRANTVTQYQQTQLKHTPKGNCVPQLTRQYQVLKMTRENKNAKIRYIK